MIKSTLIALSALLASTANAIEIGDVITIPKDQIHCTDVSRNNCRFYFCGPDNPRPAIAGVEVVAPVSLAPVLQLKGGKYDNETCANLLNIFSSSVPARLIKKTEEIFGVRDRHVTLVFELDGEIELTGEGNF